MIYLGALDYYFWQGVKAGYSNSIQYIEIPLSLDVARNSELAYADGYSIGQELTKKDFNLLTKPKVRLKNKKPVKAKIEQIKDDFKGNIDLEGEC